MARNERIQNLEALLQDADRRLAMQNQKFEAQLQAVKERLDQARGMSCDIAIPLSWAETFVGTSAKGRDVFAIKLWPDRQAAAGRRRECSGGRHQHAARLPEHGEPFGKGAERGLWVRLLCLREDGLLLTVCLFAFVWPVLVCASFSVRVTRRIMC